MYKKMLGQTETRTRVGSRGGGVRKRGGMTVIHSIMAPQYLNSNHVT